MASYNTPDLQLVGRAPEYVPFIASAWMHGGRDGDAMLHVPRQVYDILHHKTLERLYNDPTVTVLLAAHPPDPNYVFGFLVGEATNVGPVLHWLHVRRSMRGYGIARELLRAFLAGQAVAAPSQRPRAYYSQGNATWRRTLDAAHSAPFADWDWCYVPWLLWDPMALRGGEVR